MKFRQLNSIALLWYCKRLYLPTCLVLIVHEVKSNHTMGVEEKGDVPILNPGPMTAYQASNVLVSSTDSTGKGSLVVLDSKVMKHLKSKLFKGDLLNPTVHAVPGRTFKFHALIIAGTISDRESTTGLTIANVNNFLAPIFYGVSDKSMRMGGNPYSFGNPAWIGRDECFICRSVRVAGSSRASNRIMLFKKDLRFYAWDGRAIFQMKCSFIHVFKNIWKSFSVLFAIDQIDNALKMVWYDDDKDQQWTDLTKVNSVAIADDAPVTDVQFIDANLDGEMDMLVSVANYEGEVRAYQVPRTRNFKFYYEYNWFLMVSDFKSVEGKGFCPHALKPFIPFKEYKGKPWVLVSEGDCGKVVYLVPESDDRKSWTYQKYLVFEGSERIDGIEVTDINNDGFTDIFVSIGKRGIVKMFSLSDSVPGKLDVFVASNSSFYGNESIPTFDRASSGLLVNYTAFVISSCFFSFSFVSMVFYGDVI